MQTAPRNVVVLGSTGSIGRNALEVIAADSNQRLFALSAHSRLGGALQQVEAFRPRYLVATDPDAANQIGANALPHDTQLLFGAEAVEQVVRDESVDTVVSAIVGSAGLRGSWAAVDAGKRVALANKETLVVAGPLVMQLAADQGAELIPVDSEHSAIFQALQAGRRQDMARLVLTASGGPFLRMPLSEQQYVTVEQALRHPTWDMGPKITIDSATLLNKALEVIEARWLFDTPADQIQVVIHPQSIVHSMVEYVDGSVIAQLSPPDMKLPIQYALTYPQRVAGLAPQMDWLATHELTFEPPDPERFPALELGHQVADAGGTSGAVLNAAKEQAVQLFMDGQIAFCQIVEVCREILQNHTFDPSPSLDQLLSLDQWARQEVDRWIKAS